MLRVKARRDDRETEVVMNKEIRSTWGKELQKEMRRAIDVFTETITGGQIVLFSQYTVNFAK